MRKFRIFALTLASVASLAFCACSDDNGPVIKKEVSRMTHFIRLDVSQELQTFADITCEYTNIYGEKVTEDMFGKSTYLVEDTWRPDSGVEEPKSITMTLTATPRGDADTTQSKHLFEVSLQSEFTVYDQNNQALGYNAIVKSLSKTVDKGTNIKNFLSSNFPVTYSFIITKGDNGAYSVQVQ